MLSENIERKFMKEIECAICRSPGNYKVLYKPNFEFDHFDTKIFSARRLPDRIHYQIVRCLVCGLVYSNPILEENKLNSLYNKSIFTYDDQVPFLNTTYLNYLNKLSNFGMKRGRILDIGCGNGFFLDQAKKSGFEEVYGIEPSIDAIKKANPSTAKTITHGMFKKGVFRENFFDVVTIFQTLDHVVDPNSMIEEAKRILKPNGLILALNHDSDSITAKILGDKSPIFDIEHIYLYNKKTMRKLFENKGFEVIRILDVSNTYPLNYWVRMSPLPAKRKILNLLVKSKVGNIELSINGGNIALIGRKRE